ncbi:MFS transporter [Cellulomonas sp. ATA003]|uniref:MFS transporter n=1 Tax=Cellulomonas sp. ATA003 TaxID=3073064 RepID=UPI00287335D8|nr:MFS transporter [Cellulomonas sp. ATA003]WNB86879.1 MFS transporter [Cellulomonas sp. ATA003]
MPRSGTGSAGLLASGAGLIAVAYGLVRYGYGLQLPQLTEDFALSPGIAGAIASGSFGAYCVAALAAQRLIGRRGAGVVLWSAAALAASGASLVAVSWSTGTLALGVLVAGSAAGAASPALVVAVASTVREPLVARAQAMVNAGTGIGVAVTGAVTLAAPQAWRPLWACAAVAALLTAAAVDRRTCWPPGPRLRATTGEVVGRSGGSAWGRPCAARSSPPSPPAPAAQPCGPSVATSSPPPAGCRSGPPLHCGASSVLRPSSAR